MQKAAHITLLIVAVSSLAQSPPGGPIGKPDMDRPGPWDNDLLVYRIAPNDRPEKLVTFMRAGVPTLARLADGRILSAFQNFPNDNERKFDRVAVRYSSDEGHTWTAATPITVSGMEAGLARPFDPTLVPLPDGRVRLYFTSNRSPDFRRSTPAIYSAISTNGLDYVFEPGVRFAIEGRIVIDCAAVLHQGLFHLFVPDNGTAEDFLDGEQRHVPPAGGVAYHATSADGLTFARLPDVKISGGHRWLGNAQSDGRTITFAGTASHEPGRGNEPRGGIWLGRTTNGSAWGLTQFIPLQGADPGFVAARGGGWVVAVTGPPRPGTPSARRHPSALPPPAPRDQQR